MPSNRKGFILVPVLVAIAAVAVGAALYYRFRQPNFGAVVYTTQLSDTIGTFRNQVNSSTANLNTELETVSSTVMTHTALLNLLPVANGGTATSTAPANNQFLSSNGAVPTWKTLVASSGITISSTTTSTIISTQGFDPTQSFAFTGNNTHAGSETFNSSTVINGTTTVNGPLTVSSSLVVNSTVSSNASTFPLFVPITQVASSSFASTSIPTQTEQTFAEIRNIPAFSPTDQIVYQAVVTTTGATPAMGVYFYINGTRVCNLNGMSSATSSLAQMAISMLNSTSSEYFFCSLNNTSTYQSQFGTMSINLGVTSTASTTVRNGFNGSAYSFSEPLFQIYKYGFK